MRRRISFRYFCPQAVDVKSSFEPAWNARLKLSHLNGEVQNWISQVQLNRGIIKQPGLVGGHIEIIMHFDRSVL